MSSISRDLSGIIAVGFLDGMTAINAKRLNIDILTTVFYKNIRNKRVGSNAKVTALSNIHAGLIYENIVSSKEVQIALGERLVCFIYENMDYSRVNNRYLVAISSAFLSYIINGNTTFTNILEPINDIFRRDVQTLFV